MEKIIIQGRRVETTGRNDDYQYEILRKYFPGGKIVSGSNAVNPTSCSYKYNWKPNSYYFSSYTPRLKGCPKTKIIKSVAFGDKPYSATTHRCLAPQNINSEGIEIAEGTPEKAIAFKYSNTLFRAYYYIESKTLVAQSDFALVKQVISWLLDNKYLEEKTVLLEEKFTDGLEIHDGVKSIVKLKLPRQEVTLGCDPEFEVLTVNNSVAHPCPPPARYKGGSTVIGLDGAGSQIEFRPEAQSDINKLIDDLKNCMEKIPDPISTKGDQYPVGGHIHVGVGCHYHPTPELLSLLDSFLGKPTLPLSGAARGGYACTGTYESKRWGFEYRTPPAAIFTSPEFARLSFKIVKGIVECYINEQTMKITKGNLTFEDYYNYCFFTLAEYEQWQSLIANYPKLTYDTNIAAYWTTKANVSANFKVCPDILIGQEKCNRATCRICYSSSDVISLPPEPALSPSPACTPPEERLAHSCLGDYICNNQAELTGEDVVLNRQRRNVSVSISALSSHLAEGHSLQLSDNWCAESLQAVHETIEEFLVAQNGAHRFNPPVTFIGLRASRGNVTYGYTIENYNTLTPADVPGGDTARGSDPNIYGVPAICRTPGAEGIFDQAQIDLCKAHIRAIIEQRQNILAQSTVDIPDTVITDGIDFPLTLTEDAPRPETINIVPEIIGHSDASEFISVGTPVRLHPTNIVAEVQNANEARNARRRERWAQRREEANARRRQRYAEVHINLPSDCAETNEP